MFVKYSLLSKLCSYTHEILIFLQENVKNCVVILHFASASGGLRPQTPWPLHHVNPLHYKILCTPMSLHKTTNSRQSARHGNESFSMVDGC